MSQYLDESRLTPKQKKALDAMSEGCDEALKLVLRNVWEPGAIEVTFQRYIPIMERYEEWGQLYLYENGDYESHVDSSWCDANFVDQLFYTIAGLMGNMWRLACS